MQQAASRKIRIRHWSLITSCSVIPLIINPWNNFDAVNLPKFLLLLAVAGALFPSTLAHVISAIRTRNFHSKVEFLAVALPVLFLFSFLLPLTLSESNIWSQLYGAQGRNTGIFAYVSLVVIFWAFFFAADLDLVKAMLRILPVVASLISIYAIIQYLGLDPINWRNPYSPVVSTMGNPNFVSSFLGISSVITLASLMNRGFSILQALFFFSYAIQITAVFLSGSVQGLVVVIIGLALVLLKTLLGKRANLLKAFLVLGFVFGLVSLAGFFGIGPLGDVLQRPSLVYRYYFWLAGLNMLLQNPFSGIGVDRFADWYKSTRSPEMVKLIGEAVTTDSAHNVLIDLAAGGGLIVFTASLLIFGLITIRALHAILSIVNLTKQELVIHAAWLCYLFQSLISINQLGLAVMGFMLGGVSLKLSLLDQESESDIPSRKKRMSISNKRETNLSKAKLSSVISLVMSLAIASPAYFQDVNFRAGFRQSNGALLIKASSSFPPNEFLMTYTAIVLADDGFKVEARKLLLEAITVNPRYDPAYLQLLALDTTPESERATYRKILREVNPFLKI